MSVDFARFAGGPLEGLVLRVAWPPPERLNALGTEAIPGARHYYERSRVVMDERETTTVRGARYEWRGATW